MLKHSYDNDHLKEHILKYFRLCENLKTVNVQKEYYVAM